MSDAQHLRIVMWREDEMYVAQCLEYDICTQAHDIDTLQDRMNCLIDVELSEQPAIDEAPESYHKMWDQAFKRNAGNHQYGLMAA